MKLDKEQLQEFGQWLAVHRKLNVLSQVQMAKILGVKPPYIHRVERGQVTPSEDYIVKATHVFGIKPKDVAEFVGYLHEKKILKLLKRSAA